MKLIHFCANPQEDQNNCLIVDIYYRQLQEINGLKEILNKLNEINFNIFLQNNSGFEVKNTIQLLINKSIRINYIIKHFVYKLMQRVLNKHIKNKNFQNELLLDFETFTKELKNPIIIYEGLRIWALDLYEVLNLFHNSLENHDEWSPQPQTIKNPYTNTELNYAKCLKVCQQIENVISFAELKKNILFGMFVECQYDLKLLLRKHNHYLYSLSLYKHLESQSNSSLYETFYEIIVHNSFQNVSTNHSPLPSDLINEYRKLLNPQAWKIFCSSKIKKANLIKNITSFLCNNTKPPFIKLTYSNIPNPFFTMCPPEPKFEIPDDFSYFSRAPFRRFRRPSTPTPTPTNTPFEFTFGLVFDTANNHHRTDSLISAIMNAYSEINTSTEIPPQDNSTIIERILNLHTQQDQNSNGDSSVDEINTDGSNNSEGSGEGDSLLND